MKISQFQSQIASDNVFADNNIFLAMKPNFMVYLNTSLNSVLFCKKKT